MEIEEKISELERLLKRELSLKFNQIRFEQTDVGFEFYLNMVQGNKTLIITKYLLTDKNFCDLKCYLVSTLALFDNTDELELTKQSFDDFFEI
ncbi:hypothetical protein [Vibrio parahaemolyticus]|uniref:hypothetical protein n=1 Tax=Vibrio parahaemolyticus TaxID=670 RepID=UPI0011700F4B|nr:hypothetical protein [Vibrio parahaemolyticus]TOG38341.1 hypothetical protein CGJ02_25165 [Vibrio parahaemolyticus]